ncbi:Acyl-CoA reductase [Alteribacillus persepolensis]|uniref:3-sulfolactaldehyde dehydrogenase n=1 Tax=Alteribacillus persepolensis TaxID=568899 RepID=A0A1G8KDU6_9BACI|nr:aldehyde dehydrogenase family protein [Alteribacillus persepolensis]SDI41616.1 Acyl-CoA reductase [Alteribacillus persepolensis]
MTTLTELFFGSIIDGKNIKGNGRLNREIRNPYNNEVVGKIEHATKEDVDHAIGVAEKVYKETMKNMPAYQRAEILRKVADLLEIQAENFIRTIALEAGKPIREGRAEVDRAIQVLRFAAEGAKNIYGEQIPLDSASGGENQLGISRRYPIGVVVAITPFNFPLNLVLHKIAPAIAAGNTVVLKPAGQTPLTAALLYKLLEKAGLPKGALNIVMGSGSELGDSLITDSRVKKITFTGSGPVGWKIKEKALTKKVTLELGSNAPNIIFDDANLDDCVPSLIRGGVTFAGQACVSVQRIYAQRNIFPLLVEKLVEEVKNLKVGDPLESSTDVGPLISESEAGRAEAWIQEAVEQGAKVVIGGKRNNALIEPTILVDVNHQMKVVCDEVFAPIMTVIPFDTEEEVIDLANDSDYGLQAGVFTKDISRGFRLADALETGGVWINQVSLMRYDHIPYGGVKLSGVGKEGVKYAIEDMTELKFIGINLK